MKYRKYIVLITILAVMFPIKIFAVKGDSSKSENINTVESSTENIENEKVEIPENLREKSDNELTDKYSSTEDNGKKRDIEKELIEENEKVYKAQVVDVVEKGRKDELGNYSEIVRVKFLSGPDKNREKNVEYYYDEALNLKLNLNEGAKVLVAKYTAEDSAPSYSIVDNYRVNYLAYLAIAFAALLIVVGGLKGVRTLISIVLTVVILFFAAIPLIIRGFNTIAVGIVSSVIILILNTVIAAGYNRKALSTIAGTSLGVIIAGLIAYYVGNIINLRGISMDESHMLFALKDIIKFTPEGILFTGIIWGTLGAVMDVGMSISSSINEIKIANPGYGFRDLFKSGIAIGRDIMSTMSNTLILAYFGSSLPLILLIIISNENLLKVINMDFIATEIVRSLAGSIGLILTIPITAFIASVLTSKGCSEEKE